MTRARLADIAAHAGVSEATVSRVLNDKPGVAPTTRQAVLTAVDVLGYDRPTKLRRKAVSLVGLVMPELENPVFPAFAQIIETTLANHGYTPVLCTQTPGGVHEDDYVDMLLDRGVAGIIFVSGLHADTTKEPDRYQRLLDRGLPIVLVNGYLPGLEAPFISTDDAAAMELAVRHLATLGHTKIGLAVGPARFVPVVRKMAGFVKAQQAILQRDEAEVPIINTLFSVEGGASAAKQLIEAGCTAIVSGSDMMALGAIRQARTLGLAVPDDISVVGYDDSPLMAFTDPPLTTVRQGVREMAEEAVRTLLDVVAGHPLPPGELIFRPDLVVRNSTGVAARRPVDGASAVDVAGSLSRIPAPGHR
ncbi:LacI family DNA-binding transcriptional regulator [Kribbia dieselivorans]|uniref:LacI family DNA-binding transcriptional regulator n=1 Tax=Kribbia dieselivorans TaxID=331526 RepID=UPI0008381873|nr:LacI family DNA-binding transcriptional regulator [Kribbia dieselivorans]